MRTKQQSVISSFISLTEKIANSRTNVLDFGSPEMTFYRGEIHMIKMIGDFPGIYSSELARKLGVTRAVVHRTITILEKRSLLEKTRDSDDKKRVKLFLTTLGEEAYTHHEDYHQLHDKALFDYLNELPEEALNTIQDFLKHATNLIDNHAQPSIQTERTIK